MSRPHYPHAERLDLVEELHGQRVADPYRWLEDAESVATRTWSAGQDEVFVAHTDDLPGRVPFGARIRALLGAGSVGPPIWRGGRRFFLRRTAEQEHAVLYTVDPGTETERPLIDPTALDATGTTTLDSWQPDQEGRLLAYQISRGGDEESVLYVLDVATGEQVDGPIDRCRYSPIGWLPGGAACYYTRRLAPRRVPEGEEQYHRRLYLHRIGTPVHDDVLIFGADRDKTNYYGASVSRDGRWLTVSASRGTDPRTDLWLADLSVSPPEAPKLGVVQEGVDADTGIEVGRDGRLYVFTDRQAPRGRLAVADPHETDPENWRDLIPEDPEAVFDDYAVLDGAELDRPVLLAGWTRHGISEITVHDLATGERIGEVPLPGLGSIGGLVERPEGGHEAWFAYTDTTTPVGVRRYDARSGRTSGWADAPGAVETPPVQTRQISYASADGTTIRMLVVAPPGRHGPRPTILNGYGGFGLSMTPGYSASILAWVQAGGVYAVAGLRGGGEEGEQWHRAGMLEHKQRVFDDFHAAAQTLLTDGWASSVGIQGGSNGGLLVGAALTQRPELYAAVVCSAPLLDMVRYERFGLGQLWNGEYGTADDPQQLGWLLSYSPYHHVRDGVAYPATLFTVFDADARVDPLHARKMCAALQHATSGDAPILLRRETDVGHGARSVSRSVALSATTLSFLAAHTGLTLEPFPGEDS